MRVGTIFRDAGFVVQGGGIFFFVGVARLHQAQEAVADQAIISAIIVFDSVPIVTLFAWVGDGVATALGAAIDPARGTRFIAV